MATSARRGPEEPAATIDAACLFADADGAGLPLAEGGHRRELHRALSHERLAPREGICRGVARIAIDHVAQAAGGAGVAGRALHLNRAGHEQVARLLAA